MRRLLLLTVALIIISIILAGCSENTSTIVEKPDIDIDPMISGINEKDSTPSILPGTSNPIESPMTTGHPFADIISDTKGDGLYIYYPKRDQHLSMEKVRSWEEYINDIYGLDISLTYINYKDNFYDIDVDTLSQVSAYDGFVFLQSRDELADLVEKGILLPVNDAIYDIPEYSSIDDNVLMSYADSNGRLWALPLNDNTYVRDFRRYNADWLEMAGMDIPETIEEFYDFAVYVAENDPDGNGIDDSYICDITQSMLFWMMGDVFKAFGCYGNETSPVGYNPQKRVFENMIFNEGFEDAIMFLKNLVDEGYIFIADERSFHNDAIKDYKLASGYYLNINLDYIDRFAFGGYLSGENKTMLIEECISGNFFAVLKNTVGAADKINSLFEVFRNSDSAYMDFAFGIEGVQYNDKGDYYEIPRLESYSVLSGQIGLGIHLDNLVTRIKEIRYAGQSNSASDPKIIAYHEAFGEARNNAMEQLGSELSFSKPLKANTISLTRIEQTIQEPTYRLLTNILEGRKDFSTAISEYKANYNVILAESEIEKMNEILEGD